MRVGASVMGVLLKVMEPKVTLGLLAAGSAGLSVLTLFIFCWAAGPGGVGKPEAEVDGSWGGGRDLASLLVTWVSGALIIFFFCTGTMVIVKVLVAAGLAGEVGGALTGDLGTGDLGTGRLPHELKAEAVPCLIGNWAEAGAK